MESVFDPPIEKWAAWSVAGLAFDWTTGLVRHGIGEQLGAVDELGARPRVLLSAGAFGSVDGLRALPVNHLHGREASRSSSAAAPLTG